MKTSRFSFEVFFHIIPFNSKRKIKQTVQGSLNVSSNYIMQSNVFFSKAKQNHIPKIMVVSETRKSVGM